MDEKPLQALRTRQPDEPDRSVRLVVTILEFYRWAVPYEWAAAAFRHRRADGSVPQDLIAWYTLGWTFLLGLMFGLAPVIVEYPEARWAVALLTVICMSEVVRWWLSILLDRGHNRFL